MDNRLVLMLSHAHVIVHNKHAGAVLIQKSMHCLFLCMYVSIKYKNAVFKKNHLKCFFFMFVTLVAECSMECIVTQWSHTFTFRLRRQCKVQNILLIIISLSVVFDIWHFIFLLYLIIVFISLTITSLLT